MKNRLDFGTVLLIILVLILFAALTFELWIPHPFGGHP